MTSPQRLRRQIEWVLPEQSAAFNELLTHPRFRELYPEFLILVHQMIRATVPLMRTALRRCRELADHDPVAAAMVPYLAQHIREELYHDDWMLEDLEFLGIRRAEVLRRMPSPAVASLIGAHYYWIHHHHPVAKLGQIAVMEGYPSTVAFIDLLAERTGYARPAFRTLEKHCHLDTQHRDDFNTLLDGMPLQEEHHAILETSALHTVRGAVQTYRELLKRAAGAVAPEPVTTVHLPRVPARRPDLVARRIAENGQYRLEEALGGAPYQVGEQEYFLLTQCDGHRSIEAVRGAFAERFGVPLTQAELSEFLEMAGEAKLLAPDDPR
jgi:hypothetical protein